MTAVAIFLYVCGAIMAWSLELEVKKAVEEDPELEKMVPTWLVLIFWPFFSVLWVVWIVTGWKPW